MTQVWILARIPHVNHPVVTAVGIGRHQSHALPRGHGSGHWRASVTCTTTGSRQWIYHGVTAMDIGVCHSLTLPRGHDSAALETSPPPAEVTVLGHQENISSKAPGILALPEIRVSEHCTLRHHLCPMCYNTVRELRAGAGA